PDVVGHGPRSDHPERHPVGLPPREVEHLLAERGHEDGARRRLARETPAGRAFLPSERHGLACEQPLQREQRLLHAGKRSRIALAEHALHEDLMGRAEPPPTTPPPRSGGAAPRPSTRRPPVAACVVSAWAASVIGWRP